MPSTNCTWSHPHLNTHRQPRVSFSRVLSSRLVLGAPAAAVRTARSGKGTGSGAKMVVGPATLRTSLAFVSIPVFAQSKEETKKVLKVEQMSLYTTPAKTFRFEEAKPTRLEESISMLRKSAEPYTTQYQGVYNNFKPKIEQTVQFGKDSYTFLKNPPPGFYPRAGVITLAGVAGLLLAGRGSRVRKIIYSCGFVAACGSLYYPQATVEIAKATSSSFYEMSMQTYLTVESLWKKYKDQKPESSPTQGNNQAKEIQISGPKSSS
ncbi:MICOS complex subunit MIC26-like [Narcine bancroftii]|uniref:MICOS complex subunit MIC26-like n=1 Tax=Narcine bancroftii TaxID=1343680 RepID=UPI0038312247